MVYCLTSCNHQSCDTLTPVILDVRSQSLTELESVIIPRMDVSRIHADFVSKTLYRGTDLFFLVLSQGRDSVCAFSLDVTGISSAVREMSTLPTQINLFSQIRVVGLDSAALILVVNLFELVVFKYSERDNVWEREATWEDMPFYLFEVAGVGGKDLILFGGRDRESNEPHLDVYRYKWAEKAFRRNSSRLPPGMVLNWCVLPPDEIAVWSRGPNYHESMTILKPLEDKICPSTWLNVGQIALAYADFVGCDQGVVRIFHTSNLLRGLEFEYCNLERKTDWTRHRIWTSKRSAGRRGGSTPQIWKLLSMACVPVGILPESGRTTMLGGEEPTARTLSSNPVQQE